MDKTVQNCQKRSTTVNVWHGAKNVRYSAENIRHGAENVRHGTINVRHGAKKRTKVWNNPGWDELGKKTNDPNSIQTFGHPEPPPTTLIV